VIGEQILIKVMGEDF